MVSIHGPLGYEPNALTTAPLRWIHAKLPARYWHLTCGIMDTLPAAASTGHRNATAACGPELRKLTLLMPSPARYHMPPRLGPWALELIVRLLRFGGSGPGLRLRGIGRGEGERVRVHATYEHIDTVTEWLR